MPLPSVQRHLFVDTVDPAALRSARTQLHQGVGALELVGLPAAARLAEPTSAAVAQGVTGNPGRASAALGEAGRALIVKTSVEAIRRLR